MGQQGFTTGIRALAAHLGRYPLALLEVAINCTRDTVDPRAGMPQPKQQPGREPNPYHQQRIGLKLYWARSCPPEQEPVFPTASPSHQEACLLASFIREQTEEARRPTVPQQLKQKPHYRKLIRMKVQKVMSQMKVQDKT